VLQVKHNDKKEGIVSTGLIRNIITTTSLVLAGGMAYSAVELASAATPKPTETIYVERVVEVERVVYVPEPEPEPIFANISDADRECLSLNVYFESKGEGLLGQAAVAWVTLNRVTHSEFPNDICGTVWASKAFSWTNDGKSDVPTDADAWATAQQVVDQVLQEYGLARDPVDGATYFHATYVTPNWAKSFERVVRIDGHIFYADRG
jgi:N-acetylmuramoyl-L-alanine amidase